MSDVKIRDMESADEYFVGTCSHVNESNEIDACGKKRVSWLKRRRDDGLRAKVALVAGRPVGFLYTMPIEVCPWGPVGQELMAMPCLYVLNRAAGKRVGRDMVGAAVEEARGMDRKGLTTTAYYHDFWFMPASYFEAIDFTTVKRRGNEALMWRVIDEAAEPPDFLTRNYHFDRIPGKVVIDLFWNMFCTTSALEAERVREVAAEFGNDVVLNEYPADDPDILARYQIPRAIYINGKEVSWGYNAPRDGLRRAVSEAYRAG